MSDFAASSTPTTPSHEAAATGLSHAGTGEGTIVASEAVTLVSLAGQQDETTGASRVSCDGDEETASDISQGVQGDVVRQYVEDFLLESEINTESPSEMREQRRDSDIVAVPAQTVGSHSVPLSASMTVDDISASLTVRHHSDTEDDDALDGLDTNEAHSPWGAVPVPSSLAKVGALSPLQSPDVGPGFGTSTTVSSHRTGLRSPCSNGGEEVEERQCDSPHSTHSGTQSYVPPAVLIAALTSPRGPQAAYRAASGIELPSPASLVADGFDSSGDAGKPHAPPLSGFQPLQGRGRGGHPMMSTHTPNNEARQQRQHNQPQQRTAAPLPSPQGFETSWARPNSRELMPSTGTPSGGTVGWRNGAPPLQNLSQQLQAAHQSQSQSQSHSHSPSHSSYARTDGNLALSTPGGFSPSPAPGTRSLGASQAPDPNSASTSSSQTYSTQGWRLSSVAQREGGLGSSSSAQGHMGLATTTSSHGASAGIGGSSFILDHGGAPNSLMASRDGHGAYGAMSGQSFLLSSGFHQDGSQAGNVNPLDASMNRIFTSTPLTMPLGGAGTGYALHHLQSSAGRHSYTDPRSQSRASYSSQVAKPMYTLNPLLMSGSMSSGVGMTSEEASLWSGDRGVLSLMSTFESRPSGGGGGAQGFSPMQSQHPGYSLSASTPGHSMAMYTSPTVANMQQLYVLPQSVTTAQNAVANVGTTNSKEASHASLHASYPRQAAPQQSLPQPLSASALQSGLLSAHPPPSGQPSASTPLLILGDAANPNVPRKTANVHGALAGVLRYVSYEEDVVVDAQGNVTSSVAATSHTHAGANNHGSSAASSRGGMTLAPTTVISTQWGASGTTSPTQSPQSRARSGSALHSPSVSAAVAASAPPYPVACVAVGPLQSAATVPIFIQMFPCELRDRVRVLNTVMAKVSALAQLSQTLGVAVSVEPRSETSFIAKVRTPAVWRLLYLLRCRVLMDRHGFWYAETMEQYVQLKEYCEDVRRLPQQTRHYQTDGLPCMPLVVEMSRSADRHAGTSGLSSVAPPHPAFVPFDQLVPMASVDRHRSKQQQQQQQLSSPSMAPSPVSNSTSSPTHTLNVGSQPHTTPEQGWSVTATQLPTAAAAAIQVSPSNSDQRRSSVGFNVGGVYTSNQTAPPLQSAMLQTSGEPPHPIHTVADLQLNSPDYFASQGRAMNLNKSAGPGNRGSFAAQNEGTLLGVNAPGAQRGTPFTFPHPQYGVIGGGGQPQSDAHSMGSFRVSSFTMPSDSATAPSQRQQQNMRR